MKMRKDWESQLLKCPPKLIYASASPSFLTVIKKKKKTLEKIVLKEIVFISAGSVRAFS